MALQNRCSSGYQTEGVSNYSASRNGFQTLLTRAIRKGKRTAWSLRSHILNQRIEAPFWYDLTKATEFQIEEQLAEEMVRFIEQHALDQHWV